MTNTVRTMKASYTTKSSQANRSYQRDRIRNTARGQIHLGCDNRRL